MYSSDLPGALIAASTSLATHRMPSGAAVSLARGAAAARVGQDGDAPGVVALEDDAGDQPPDPPEAVHSDAHHHPLAARRSARGSAGAALALGRGGSHRAGGAIY